MNILSELYIHFKYSKVGQDQFGNTYHESTKADPHTRLNKRVVLYKGIAEPSKIPALWHAWLHHYLTECPDKSSDDNCSWYKEKTPNLTGTNFAHFPSGYIAHNSKRNKVSSDYNAWSPNDNDIIMEEHEQ